jgi:hypothetical protein
VRKVVALERDVARILVTIRLAMNQTAPINRLPPEVLARTLEFRKDDKDLISATHVCHQWRSALTSTPSLWTEAVFRNSNRVLAYLTRSGALPIDVSFIPTRVSFETWKFDPKDFYISQIPWIDRMKSLDIGGDEEQIEAIVQRLCLPAPLLQHLKFDGRPNRSLIWRSVGAVRFPRDFLGGRTPSLQSLSFNSISPTPIIKLPLTNLTSFTWIDKDSKATVKDLLTLLTSAPLLEVLTIHLRIWSVSTAERTTVVTLNRLCELTWSNSGGTFSLASCLIAPELGSLSLRLVPDADASQNDLASILPPDEGYFPSLVEPTELKYIAREGTLSCQLHSATGYISITVLPVRPDDLDSWFLRNASISFRQIRQMTLEVNYPPLGELPIEQFESLETLELVDGGNIYFLLVQPSRRSFGGPLVIPFPALRELRITFDSNISLDILAEVLMERKQAGHGVETVRIRGACAKSMDGPIAKMRECLGELVLEITHKFNCTGHLTQL